MITPQLLSYIKIQLQKNISAEEIKKTLLANGWQMSDIEEGFLKASAPVSASVFKPAPMAQAQLSTEPISTVSSQSVITTKTSGDNRKSNRFLLALSVVAFFLILGAGGTWAYFNYYAKPVLTPDQVLARTLGQLSQIKSLAYEGEFRVEFNQAEVLRASQKLAPTSTLALVSTGTTSDANAEVTGEIKLNFNGLADFQIPSEPKSSFVFNISTLPFGAVGSTTTNSTSSVLKLGAEFRSVGQVLYVKLNNVPDLGFFDLTPFVNQWITFDVASTTKVNTSLSDEQLAKVKALLAQQMILKVAEVLPDEKIGEIETYHYRLIVDKVELKQVIIDITNITLPEGLKAEDLQKLDQGLTSAEIPNLEVWITKKDFYPAKILTSSVIKNAEQSANIGEITFWVTFKDFNQPLVVLVPETIKTLQELLGLPTRATSSLIQVDHKDIKND